MHPCGHLFFYFFRHSTNKCCISSLTRKWKKRNVFLKIYMKLSVFSERDSCEQEYAQT